MKIRKAHVSPKELFLKKDLQNSELFNKISNLKSKLSNYNEKYNKLNKTLQNESETKNVNNKMKDLNKKLKNILTNNKNYLSTSALSNLDEANSTDTPSLTQNTSSLNSYQNDTLS